MKKKFIHIIPILLSITLVQCKTNKEVISSLKKEVILLDSKMEQIIINNTYKEPVKAVYLYDINKKLVEKITRLPTNESIKISSKNIHIVHVLTFKAWHIKHLKSSSE